MSGFPSSRRSRRMRRGKCSGCGFSQVVRQDGKVWKHVDPFKPREGTCPGADSPPKPW